ncbi:ATP-binding protein [Cellulomonas sp. JZ18]|uniref:ATP-binding protein n=1 Tax=Cellulomonas sp. JZ18 TaxID=2654191 RepID=UPI0012D4907E|nr:ATP-binding protein [Cellulomonas sp. JZ18]QGQ19411.1 ATP-binding protein [Cellulomonas sp. JZ18]
MHDPRSGLNRALPQHEAPRTFVTVARWRIDQLSDLARLRRDLRVAVAAGTGMPAPTVPRIVADLTLVASELATNALRHGAPPVIVELGARDGAFLVGVTDQDAAQEPVVAGRRAPGAGGFGLVITQSVAASAGWHVNGTGKRVWAVLGGDGDSEKA